MTASTRVRLGSYFLFALLLLTVPAALLVTHLDSVRHAPQLMAKSAAGVAVANGDFHLERVRFEQKRWGISTDAAEKRVREIEKRDKVTFDVGETIPYGANVDYVKVKSDGVKETAEYAGSARVAQAGSKAAQLYLKSVRELPAAKKSSDFLDELARNLKKGYVMVPTAFRQSISKTGKGVSSKATTPYNLCVLVAEFPPWYDQSPLNVAPLYNRGVEGSGDRTYFTSGNGTWTAGYANEAEYAMAGNNSDVFPINQDVRSAWVPSSYADSAGGALSDGYPQGPLPGWNETHRGRGPTWDTNTDYVTNPEFNTDIKVKNYWNWRYFDLANPNSVRQYFYQQTHNHVAINGPGAPVQGWLRSHHVLDRYPFGSGQVYAIQPGTPIIRPLPSTSPQGILRASFSGNELTVVFNQDAGTPTLNSLSARVVDAGSATGTQVGPGTNGSVNLYIPSGGLWVWHVDPYDSRRWTVTNTESAIFADVSSTTGGTLAYSSANGYNDGGYWAASITLGANTWQIGSVDGVDLSGKAVCGRGQGRGCTPLDDTFGSGSTLFDESDVFSKADDAWNRGTLAERYTLLDRTVAGSAAKKVRLVSDDVGNRLKCFDYYCHTHNFYRTINNVPYQLRHLRARNTDYTDDIGGTVESTTDREDRPAPFDFCRNDLTTPNGGLDTGAPGDAGHTSDELQQDVDKVCRDAGIDITQYDRRVYVYPGTEGDITPHSDLGGERSFIPDGANLGTLVHEQAHTFWAVDLYDNDYYNNRQSRPRPNPLFFLCDTLGPYSIMADQGNANRLDAWTLIKCGWAKAIPVYQDSPATDIPMSERALEDPVILKLPANPYQIREYLADPSPDKADDWQEYFLVENRSKTGTSYFGDASATGLYIYHIDERNFHYLPRQIGVFQVEERALTVAMEQADGLNELENLSRGNSGATAGDPFGRTNKTFNQLSNPSSWSHGKAVDGYGTRVIDSTTPTDSFTRVVNISDPRQTMLADIYVRPAEVIVTKSPHLTPPLEATQGDLDVPVLGLNFDNNTTAPNLSMNDVVINTIKIKDGGTNASDTTLSRVSLFQNTNGANGLQLTGTADTRIATTRVVGGYATFSNLGLRVPKGDDFDVYITYDIARTAQTSPVVTTGADLADYRQILPDAPGAVQERVRNGDWDFGAYRFPIASNNTIKILHKPSTLTITPSDVAPASALPGQNDVALLQLHLAVNVAENPAADKVNISKLTLEETGTCAATTDLRTARLYEDINSNGLLDAAEIAAPIAEANFGSDSKVTFQNIKNAAGLTVYGGVPQYVFVGVCLNTDAEVDETIRLKIADATYVTLTENPNMSSANQDIVAATNLPFESGPSPDPCTIIAKNNPPYQITTGFLPPALPAFVTPNPPLLSWTNPTPPDPDTTATPENDTLAQMTYMIEVSSTGDFANIILAASTNSAGPNINSWQIPGPALAAGKYYWHIKPVDSHGLAADDWSTTQSFQIVDNQAPVLPPNPAVGWYPVDRAVGSTSPVITQRPTITWNAATDDGPQSEITYQLMIDDNADYSSPVALAGANGISSTSYLVPDGLLAWGMTYYWRVQAKDATGTLSYWSDDTANNGVVRFFRVVNDRPPKTPIALQVDGRPSTSGLESLTGNPVLSWSMPVPPDDDPADTLATLHYEVQVKFGDGDFATGTVYTRTTPDGPALLRWAVGLASEQSDPAAPALVADNEHVYWRVRSVDGSPVPSVWTAVQDFYVNTANNAPDTPTGLEPDGGPLGPGALVPTRTPTLTWDNSGDPDLDPYDGAFTTGQTVGISWIIELSSSASFPEASKYVYNRAALTAAGDPTFTVPVQLTDATTWYWRVLAVDNDGKQSGWSSTATLYVDTAQHLPTPPVAPFVPANASSISDDTPRFSWGAGSDQEDPASALRYEVEISDDANFATTGYYFSGSTTANDQTWLDVTSALADNVPYYWHIRTVDTSAARSAWTATMAFTKVANSRPNRVTSGFAPTGGVQIADQTPTLQWNAATPPDPDADDTAATMHYEVQVDDDGDNFASPEFGLTIPARTLVAGDTHITVTTTLSVGVTYYWRVRAVDDDGATGEWQTARLSFHVVANQAPNAPNSGFRLVPVNAVPAAPNVRETSSATPRIEWNAATDPNPSDDAATMRYAVQVSTNPDFSRLPYVFTGPSGIGETFINVTTTLQDNTRYYYRVLAVDGGGLQSPWSATQSFWVNTANNPPTPPNQGFQPSSGSIATVLRPLLSWDNSVDCDPDPYDANVTSGAVIGVHFVVELGTSPSLVNPTYTYTTPVGASSYAPTDDLTEGIVWYWRVKAVDNDGAVSDPSSILSFTINTTQRAPLAPGVNTLQPGGVAAVAGSETPRLSWSAASDPDDPPQSPDTLRYEVQVSADANMATGPGYYWTNAASLPPAGQTYVQIPSANKLTTGTTYYWRVRTIDPTGLASVWTTIRQFTVRANSAPNGVTAGFAPTAGASVTANPTLSWSAATPPDPDADDTAATMTYRVEVGTNPNFLAPQFTGTTTVPGETTITVTTPLTVGVTYYWRVCAVDQKGAVGPWSLTTPMPSFVVVANQAPYAPVAPFAPNGVIVTSAVPTLRWTSPAVPDPNLSDTVDTIRYEIQINNMNDFSGTPLHAGSAPAGQTFFDVPASWNLQDDTQYFWRVRAVDAGSMTSVWSANLGFWVNTGNDAPLPPSEGFSPIDGAGIVDSTPQLSWSAGSDSDPGDTPATLRYQVQLSADNFATPATYTYATTVGGVLTLPVTTPLIDGTWYWRVRTIDTSGAAAEWNTLPVQRFVLDSTNIAPNPPATGFNPAAGRSVSTTTPTFTFAAGDDSGDPTPTDPAQLWYEVEVSNTNGFPVPPAVGGYYYLGASAVNVTSVTLPGARSLTSGIYYWRVRTVDGDNARSVWSGVQNFVVGANRPPTVPVGPFVPTGNLGVSDATPILSWGAGGDADANDTPDVLRYQVQVDDNTDFSSMLFDQATTVPGVTEIECLPTSALREGAVYYWRVQTIDSAGELSGWTASQSFHLIQNRAPYAPVAPFRVEGLPAGREVSTATPTLAWDMPGTPDPDPNDGFDVLRYQVQVSDKADLAIGPYVFTVTTTVTDPNLMQAIVTERLLDNTHYWWRVRAMDVGGLVSDWSPTQDFWVNLVNQAPRAPDSGFDPANARQIVDDTPTIRWTAAIDDDPFDGPTLHYIVELSKLEDFSRVDYQYTTADGVTAAPVTVALTDRTTWYWRVRAVDDDGAQSPWSVVQNFMLDMNNQPPVLSNPVVNPMYGPRGITYTLEVTYTDAEGDVPGKVYCGFDDGRPDLEMTAISGTARTGILYRVGVTGAYLGLGAHSHAFSCDAGARLPLTGYDLGPVVGVSSTIALTDASGVTKTTFEEGQPVYVTVRDDDENSDPAAPDTLPVRISEAGGDNEIVTLTETGADTGIFRGSVPTLGKAGLPLDGVLNAIGGTNGNLITADYMDPDDINNPTPDVCSTTATLYDTVAPARVGGRLSVTSGIDGRTADLTWESYDEAAQVDLAGYHIYRSTTDFTDTSAMTPIDTVAAGTRSYQASGLVPNTTYYFAVGTFDEVPLERHDVTASRLVAMDSNPPAISALMPADDATEVARDTTISFDLDDPGVGIDASTLQIVVTQNGQAISSQAPVVTGNAAHSHVVVTPRAPLLWNGIVQVAVTVSDLGGYQLVFSDWTFSVVTDNDSPTIEAQTPAPDATNVPVSTTIGWHLKDAKSGINTSTIKMKLNGVDVSGDLSTSGQPSDVAVLYDPPTDLSYNLTYTVEVNAQDVAGNALPTATWSFQTVRDATGIVIDQYNPARDAVDVPVETNISLRLTDPQAGINVSTLRFFVQGVDVTNNVTLTQTPDPSDHPTTLLVSYDPPQNLEYATDIHVNVQVQDVVGNTTDLTYKFTTVDAPTYNISGMITDTNGAALPGVRVTAGTLEALSDGTGAYRIVGLLEGTYQVSVSRAEYVFDIAQQEVTLAGDDAANVDFVGRLLTYSLRGTVKEAGAGLAGVSVTAGGKTAITADDGTYSIDNLPNDQYTVTPTLTNYHFQPQTRSAEVASADVSGVDFAAIADTFTVQGTVTDSLGNELQGVQVTCGTAVAVTNAAGEYTVTGLRAGTYTLSASKAGYTINPGTVEVTVPPSRTGVNFTALISMSNTFPSGWSLVGVPGTPADQNANTAFATAACYRWDPESTPATYRAPVNDPLLEVVRVRPGRGYFVNYDRQTTVQIAGEPTDPTRTVSIGLSEGWNMIANTQSMPTKWSRFVPSQADGIRPFAFVYDGVTGSYKLISSLPSVGAARDSLLGWEGAWVRAVSGGVSLLVTAGSGTAEAIVKPQQADLNGGWIIPVVAKAGNRADLTSVAGLVPGSNGQHVIENPPTAPKTVDVYFTNAAGQRLAHDVRSQAGAQTYSFVVACAVPDTNVTVRLPDLSQVPAAMQITLVDKATGKSLYARTLQSYKYHSAGESSEREFELIIAPRTAGVLAVTATTASANAEGMMMTYSVTKACSVNVRVLNLAGRSVKVLAANKLVGAGVQTQLWNLTSDSGTKVPSGTYLLQIDAVAENGQSVRGLTQVRVGR